MVATPLVCDGGDVAVAFFLGKTWRLAVGGDVAVVVLGRRRAGGASLHGVHWSG